MPLQADWKSADEIEADLASGEGDLRKLVIDLWRRVDELQDELDRQKRASGSN